MNEDPLTPFTFQTRDLERAHQYLRDTYADHQVALSAAGPDFECRDMVYQLGDVVMGQLDYTSPVDLAVPRGVDRPFIMSQSRSDASPWRFQVGRDRQYCDSRQTSIQLPRHEGYSLSYDRLQTYLVAFSQRLLEDDASALSETTLRLGFSTCVSPAADRHWQQVMGLVRHVTATDPQVASSSILRRELIRLLNSAVLTCFPNSTLDSAAPTAGRAMPAALRRAVSFIEDHAAEPIGLEDIAGAARLSPRAMQAAFRRHLDTTPLAYLREVRMDLAHHELVCAVPGTSVAGVARRWGFAHLGRFAQDHRERFGVTPREVLQGKR